MNNGEKAGGSGRQSVGVIAEMQHGIEYVWLVVRGPLWLILGVIVGDSGTQNPSSGKLIIILILNGLNGGVMALLKLLRLELTYTHYI